jgi:hypothetical protein
VARAGDYGLGCDFSKRKTCENLLVIRKNEEREVLKEQK